MGGMRIVRSRDGGVEILAIQGKLGRRTLPQMRNCVEELLISDRRRVILNLRAVPTTVSDSLASRTY